MLLVAIAKSCQSASNLGWIGDLQQLLAQVFAGEQTAQRARNIVETMLQIDLIFKVTVANPLQQVRNRFASAGQVVEDDKALHAGAICYQVHEICRPR